MRNYNAGNIDPKLTIVEVDIEYEDSLEVEKWTLVGKILTGRFLNKGAVKAILSKAWREILDLDSGLNIWPNYTLKRNALVWLNQ